MEYLFYKKAMGCLFFFFFLNGGGIDTVLNLFVMIDALILKENCYTVHYSFILCIDKTVIL